MSFDEGSYLDANPDVRRGVECGHWETGHHHWTVCGQNEGRRLNPIESRATQRFLNAFLIEPRLKLSSSIATAADSLFFVPLQCLIASLRVSHEARVVVVDLGLAEPQREWCRRHGAEVMPQPPSPFPAGSIDWWQTWCKPFNMRAIGGRMIYIDPDALVTGPLDWLDQLTGERPVLFADTIAIHRIGWQEGTAIMANKAAYYSEKPVPARFRPGEHPNGGVVGIDLGRERDRAILDAWCGAIEDAARDPARRAQVAWADQGCLQWALESLNETHVVLCDSRHNDTVSGDRLNSLEAIVDVVEGLKGTRVLHFAGDRKPYQFFPLDFVPTCIDYPENRRDLTLFIMGHDPERLSAVPELPHAQKVLLSDLDKSNQLAESRIFRSSLLDTCQTEYIGLCTARWDEKYAGECWPLARLRRLRMARNVIWAARPAVVDWVERTEESHCGMTPIIRRLASSLGISDLVRTAPWSNNFICHRDVMGDILAWWRRCWRWIEAEFGRPPKLDYVAPEGSTRHHSYLAERLTMLYFCAHPELEVRKIPAP